MMFRLPTNNGQDKQKSLFPMETLAFGAHTVRDLVRMCAGQGTA